MLNQIKDLKVAVESSEEFEKYRPVAKLASVSLLGEGLFLNYFIEGSANMVSFRSLDDQFEVQESEAFKKASGKGLDLERVKFSLGDDELEKLKSRLDLDNVTKQIINLHNENDKILWNVTFLTDTMKIINVKLNAETGSLVKISNENLLQWKN